jgi:hypothetical protein
MPDLPDDLLRLARSHGGIDLGHDVCPGMAANAPAGRYFEVRASIVEVTQPEGADFTDARTAEPRIEEMAAFRCGVTASNFEKALRPLALALGEKWTRVEKQAAIADGTSL